MADWTVAPAGLSHTPRSEKSEVSFNLNDVETYLPYAKALKDFLAKYDDENQRDQMKYEDCGGTFQSESATSKGFVLRRHFYSLSVPQMCVFYIHFFHHLQIWVKLLNNMPQVCGF